MRWSWLLEGTEKGECTLTQVLGEDMAEGLLSRRQGYRGWGINLLPSPFLGAQLHQG